MLGAVVLRDTPRWSVAGPAGSPWPMAGLPGSRARVLVGPPKLPKSPKSGSSGLADVPVRSLAIQPLLKSIWPMRLWPPEVKGPFTSAIDGKKPAVLSATMLLRIAKWSPLATRPPAKDVAALKATVSLSRLMPAVPSGPLAKLSIPPPANALLANRVLLVTVSRAVEFAIPVSWAKMPPPWPKVKGPPAVLPSMVQAVTEASVVPAASLKGEPRRNSMPPPLVAQLLPSTVERLSVTVAVARVDEPGGMKSEGVVRAMMASPPPSLPAVLPEMVLVLTVRAAAPASSPNSSAKMPPPVFPPRFPMTCTPVRLTDAWLPTPTTSTKTPPPLPKGPLLLSVKEELLTVAVAGPMLNVMTIRERPPPRFVPTLPEAVTLLRVMLAEPLDVVSASAAMPPPLPPAVLPLTVVLRIVTEAVPELLVEATASMPPPSLKPLAVFPLMTSLANVAVDEPDALLATPKSSTRTLR